MSTQLGDYYDALGHLKEQEMAALAEMHADDPSLLIYRFQQSVKAVQERAGIDAPFYPGKRPDLESPDGIEVKSTIAFARYLSDGHTFAVTGEQALAFRYVDREIFPGRTGETKTSGDRRSLDLLLANGHDQLPVLAELKIRSDKPSYFALIQVLMHAAEFQSPEQRGRLMESQQGSELSCPETGPFVDVYIIAFDPPATGKYRERLFEATKTISERLMEHPGVSGYVRRIAHLRASVEDGAMTFEKQFAFGSGIPSGPAT